MATKRIDTEVNAEDRAAVLLAITERGPMTVDAVARATRRWHAESILKRMVADGTLVREVVIEWDTVRRATFRIPCEKHDPKLRQYHGIVGDFVECTHCGKKWVA